MNRPNYTTVKWVAAAAAVIALLFSVAFTIADVSRKAGRAETTALQQTADIARHEAYIEVLRGSLHNLDNKLSGIAIDVGWIKREIEKDNGGP